MHPLWILIAFIIIIIFIRGTFPIREGARSKNKDKDKSKKTEPASASASASTSESKPNKKSAPESKPNKKTSVQNAMLKSIEKSQNKIEKTQKLVDAKLNDLSKQQEKYYLDFAKQKDDINKYYTDLSSNMYNQFIMYKTSIETVAKQAVSDISGSGVAAKKYADTAATSANEAANHSNTALKHANKAEQVYKDVFGKSSASIIQNNLSDLTTESFTGFKEGYNSIYTTQVAGNKSIYDLEAEVIAALNDFNTAYYAYMKCQSGTQTCSVKKTDVENKETVLRNAIATLKSVYQNESNDISGTAFDTQYNNMIQSSDRIASMRAELDAKMANIMTPIRDYDASVYAGITLSILAASLAYYLVFE